MYAYLFHTLTSNCAINFKQCTTHTMHGHRRMYIVFQALRVSSFSSSSPSSSVATFQQPRTMRAISTTNVTTTRVRIIPNDARPGLSSGVAIIQCQPGRAHTTGRRRRRVSVCAYRPFPSTDCTNPGWTCGGHLRGRNRQQTDGETDGQTEKVWLSEVYTALLL